MAHFAPELDSLPETGERRIAVRITKDALRQVRGGHPWVFDGSITDFSHRGASGDLAVIFDDQRQFVAIGLWDLVAPMRLRVLHRGRPTPIDNDFWLDRFSTAAERRRPLEDDPSTTGYRMINGESDGFGGLVLDRYDMSLVMKLYSVAWLPHLRRIVAMIDNLYGPERLVLRLSRELQRHEVHGLYDGMALIGEAPDDPVQFMEGGLVFGSDIVWGQKTGHFLDQRENRILIGAMAADAHVLDVFCNTGGFSVHAAAGGAGSVHSVDISSDAIATTEANMALNADHPAVQAAHHTTANRDAFEEMDSLIDARERFDIVVVDPPSFAPNAAAVNGGRRAYGRLAEQALALVDDGGVLFQSSCSSRISADDFYEVLFAAADRSGCRLQEISRTAHAMDHPATFPQGQYLKALIGRVTRTS